LAKLPISVLIDTYNHERFIEKAINSVLEQGFPVTEREIIVVDDGSTDRTPQLVKRFEAHLRYIRKENDGQASAFNVGIPECRGEIIAFLDGDDYWLPGKLSRVVDVLAKNSAVGFVGHAIKESLPDGQERISAPAKDEQLRIQSLESARLFRLSKSFLGTSRMTMRYGLAPDRVWFIPKGVGQEFFHRRAWSDTREPKLLFVGTWIDHKGIYALVEAFEQLLALPPRVQLTIAGCAETEERVRHYFSAAAQGSINVRPFISRGEMPELYAQHDIFVLPSLVEGMPLVLLEAMASGLAVVTTESSGMTDLVEDGHDGLFAIPGDADSLTVAIGTLCGNSQLRYKLGCAAQEKMKRFTWKLSALRHEAVFRRAMGVKPVPRTPESHEANIDGAPYSGKVVLN